MAAVQNLYSIGERNLDLHNQACKVVPVLLKDVRANCYCASLQRTQIHMPRHASSARAKY